MADKTTKVLYQDAYKIVFELVSDFPCQNEFQLHQTVAHVRSHSVEIWRVSVSDYVREIERFELTEAEFAALVAVYQQSQVAQKSGALPDDLCLLDLDDHPF